MLDAIEAQAALVLQLAQRRVIARERLVIQLEFFRRPGFVTLLSERLLKALLVHKQAAFFRHVADDFERQAEGVIQLERFRARHNLILNRGEHALQAGQAKIERAMETFFLVGDRAQDVIAARDQLGKVLRPSSR